MFANAYQSGPHVEVFDSKINKEKNQFYAQLYKANTTNGVKKQFDKQIKGYLFELEGQNTKLIFPKDQHKQLCLVQQYLVLQVYVPQGFPWSIQLTITDTTKTKRRINLTSAITKTQIKYFHVKYSLQNIKKNTWLNLAIDVYSFMNAFKGQTFRSLDQIVIGAYCKLRRIFTMRERLIQYSNDDESFQLNNQVHGVFVPKNFQLNNDVIQTSQVIQYQAQIIQNIKESKVQNSKTIKKTLPSSTGNSGNLKIQQRKVPSVKNSPTITIKKTQNININIKPSDKKLQQKKISIRKSQKQHIIHQKKQESIEEHIPIAQLKKQLANFEKKQKFEPMGKAKKVFLSDSEDSKIEKIKSQKIQNLQGSNHKKKQLLNKVNKLDEQKKSYEAQTTKQLMKIRQYLENKSEIANFAKKDSSIKNVNDIPEQEQYCGDFEDSLQNTEEVESLRNTLSQVKKNSLQLQNLFPSSVITKKNNETVVMEVKPQQQLQLIYDETLQCYYDPKSNMYYEIS